MSAPDPTFTSRAELETLIERLRNGEAGNALDVLIEVALSDGQCRANLAGTKVIYVNKGRDETYWARDWSLRPAETIAALEARVRAAHKHLTD